MARTPSIAPESPKELLLRYGLTAKRSFGQNFLGDPHWTGKIADVAAAGGGTVVELGAGLGHLTLALLERAERVIAVERDRDLVPILRERFHEFGARFELLEADAKALDYRSLFEGASRPRVLAGNLPYQITGPLLEITCALAQHIDRAVFLLQLEVADRLAAKPGTSAYGALSVFVQAQYAVTRPLVIRRGVFFPVPGVDSALVVLTPHAEPLAREEPPFVDLVRAAFGQRRKTLRNAWRGVQGMSITELELAAERAAINLELRGECLDVRDFARMARAVTR